MPELTVTHLRCEYLTNPLGIDEKAPRLSWALQSTRRGARQQAYRIQVATSPEALAGDRELLWDSGRVESRRTTHVAYAGQPLASRQEVCWQVTVWDDAGAVVSSEIGRWSMGLLEPSDWSAQWISYDPEILKRDPEAVEPTLTEPGTPTYFRKGFDVTTRVKRATVYATARGVIELFLNGENIGRDYLVPEWTDYDHRIQYRTFDVTDMLRDGGNAIGIILGDGWWSGYVGWQETRARYGSLVNSLLVQLELELENGETVVYGTGPDWRCDTGAIRRSDFMLGEIYDGMRKQKNWNGPGFDESKWLPSLPVEAPTVPLVAQRAEPVQETQILQPISRTEIRPNVYIYDLGQNIAGWVYLKTKAKPGTRIKIRHAERLTPAGELYTENLRRATSEDEIVVGTNGEVDFRPHFTFHGFQYFEISGLDEAPPEGAATGRMIQSATPATGHFECSNPDVNRLWLNGVWSQKDNFLSVPTDCPQRDERLGWMGDAQIFCRTAAYNADVAAFFTKWLTDVTDAQTEDGIFPDTAPRLREDDNFIGLDDLVGGAAWADAGVIIPYTMWQVYGDFRLIDRMWGAMVAWLSYLERTNPEYLRLNELRNNYGDWLCIPSDREFRTHSPMKNLLATAFWADDAKKMAHMAQALGKQDDAERFQQMYERVRAAFQKEFLRPDGSLTVDTQTAYLLALDFELIPQELRKAAADHLVENIRKLDWHLSTGFVGIRFLNPILSETGHNDVAYRLLLQDTYPSWLYPVKHGATTIWERWNGWTEEGGFFDPLMNSFNHYSLGSIGEWLYRYVAGIEVDPTKPGFQHFRLRPFPGKGLDYAKASYRTMHGEVASSWKQEGTSFNWEITIPANTEAEVSIPAAEGVTPRIDGQEAQGLAADGRFVTTLPAGTYRITSTLPSA
ncbi:MAG: family 78 glycoside hydrolase catalytic domain [Verrucomicrobiota bacterium JB022]|nr:family 78 glycoside hydrolase catalytic domain [Verrucomicrobiota bacterium JB022]